MEVVSGRWSYGKSKRRRSATATATRIVMGNCSEKCGSEVCTSLCCEGSLLRLMRPSTRTTTMTLLDIIRHEGEDAAALRLLDHPNLNSSSSNSGSSGSSSSMRSSTLEELVSHREKIDGRADGELPLMASLDRWQQHSSVALPPSCDIGGAAAPELRIYVVTWNMNGKVPPSNLATLVDDGAKHDLYIVGLQEAPNCCIDSFFLDVLGASYCLVASATMSSLQLYVFARSPLLAFISDVRTDRVGVGGFGGVVGRQKGAVGTALRFHDSTLLFVSSHLAPHEGNVETRNSQYLRICSSIFSRASNGASVCTSCIQARSGAVADVSALKQQQDEQPPVHSNAVEGADLVVWVGDLNYRVVGHRNSVAVLVRNNLEKLLWPRDQLTREVQHGRAFHNFKEGPLTFRPTYKYDIGSDEYDTSVKERVPSWTDRILYKVKPKSWVTAVVHDYNCIDTLKSSDHRPVKAVMKVKL